MPSTTGKPLVEIVSHCYAQELPHYADLLAYQLGSLLIHQPNSCDVRATICCVHTDKRTTDVLTFFKRNTLLSIKMIVLRDVNELGRRCIGRNIAAKCSIADYVWFSDVDQVYRDGVLDRLARLLPWPWSSEETPRPASIVFPRLIKISADHATGDRTIGEIRNGRFGPSVMDVDPSTFVDKPYHKAIGGVQIVRGDFAREHGYLDGQAHWQTPRTDGKPFRDFKDDLQYRKLCNRLGPIVPVDLPGVYRIRHSTTTH